MGITSALAKLSAIYNSLSKSDSIVYGVKNGEFTEIPSSFSSPVTVLPGADANTVITPGRYLITSTGTNLPAPGLGYYVDVIVRPELTSILQIAYFNNYEYQKVYGLVAMRTSVNTGASWSPWMEVQCDSVVTPDNICDLAMDGQELINTMNPHFYKKNVGAARLVDQPRLPANNYPLSIGVTDHDNTISGTGATIIGGLAGPQLNTGTTAAGYANANRYFDTTVATPNYDFYNKQVLNAAVGCRLAVRCGMHLSVASDATNTYAARITLLGYGPSNNAAPTATTTGIVLSYTHSVNSGNFVITYRGADGTLKTINTAVAPGFGGVNVTKQFIAKAHRSAAGVATITIDIAGTVYTITDSAFNTNMAYTKGTISFQLAKSVGTTSITMGIRATAIACNFP